MDAIAGIVHFEGPAPEPAPPLLEGLARRAGAEARWRVDGPALLAWAGADPARRGDLVVLADADLVGEADLAAQWEARGPDALDALDGAFALAAWDRRSRTLVLARDRHGIRPLYWARVGARLAFASDLPTLLALPWVPRRLATDHLAEYLSFRYVHAPRTLFRDVFSVRPGGLLRADALGERCDRWWTPRWSAPDAATPDPARAAETVDAALHRSVRARLPRLGRPAVLLSGGLDSSAILHHASDPPGPRPVCYTVVVDDDPTDESAFARRVARMMDAEHVLVRVGHHDLVEAVDACTRAMGQPLPSATATVQYLLYREIGRRLPLVLSGDGGDEVLGGRGLERIAFRLRTVRALDLLPTPLRELTRRAARRAGRTDLAASHAHFGRDRNIGGSRVFHSAERIALLRDPAMVRPGIRRTVLEPFYQEVETDPINAILHVWQRGWLPEDSLARSDRMAALAGIDVRYPMLGRELVDLASGMPGSAKVVPRGAGFVTKAPLRAAMAERLPRGLLHRPKRSMPSPLDEWLRTAGRDFLRWRVDAMTRDETGLFVPSEVRRLAREHLSGQRNHGLKLWTLALFHTWREAFGV